MLLKGKRNIKLLYSYQRHISLHLRKIWVDWRESGLEGVCLPIVVDFLYFYFISVFEIMKSICLSKLEFNFNFKQFYITSALNQLSIFLRVPNIDLWYSHTIKFIIFSFHFYRKHCIEIYNKFSMFDINRFCKLGDKLLCYFRFWYVFGFDYL